MTKMRKAAALLIAMIMITVCFTGCGANTIATVKNADGTVVGTIDAKDYLFYAYTYYLNVNYLASYYGETFKDYALSPLDYTAEDSQTIEEYVTEQCQQMLKEQFITDRLFTELGLTLGNDEINQINTSYQTLQTNYGADVIKRVRGRMNLNETEFKKLFEGQIKANMVYNALIDEGGRLEVTDDALYAYYSDSYARVKHILLKYDFYKTDDEGEYLKDDDGNKIEMTDEEKEAYKANVKKQAEDILTTAKATPTIEKFIALIDEYSEDSLPTEKVDTDEKDENGNTVTKEVPDYDYFMVNTQGYDYYGTPVYAVEYGGYTFAEETMYEEFTQEAFKMEAGDFSMVETDAGWHIMMKLSTDTADASEDATDEEKGDAELRQKIYDELKDYVLSAKQTEDYKTFIKTELEPYTIEFDSSLVEKYKLTNLKSVN